MKAYNKIIGSTIKRAKKIIAVSEATKKDIVKVFNTNPDKIKVIYESVDKDSYFKEKDLGKVRSIVAKYNIDTSKPYLIYTGVSRYHKNIVGAIKAVKIAREKYNIDFNFVLTGKKDKNYPEIDAEIKKQGLESVVFRTGFVEEEDLVYIYNGATAFLFPTFYEGFGLPPLEAQACGVPVICSNTASVPEIVGDAGIYFDPRKPEDIADKIRMIIVNRDLREELKQKGYKNIERFSWEKMAKETYGVYKDAF